MDEIEAAGSSAFEEKDPGIYATYFGVSCAFIALHLLSETPKTDDSQLQIVMNRMLQGSAHLLGVLVWKAQRVEASAERVELLSRVEKAVAEASLLKRMRSDDAKANEKVVSIFASQEQSWIAERKKLRKQIEALLNRFRILDGMKKEAVSSWNKKIKDMEDAIVSKDQALEEVEKEREELTEKLRVAETSVEQLKEAAQKEAREHSSELWKHKTAFIELVSSQRRLEAEMARTLQQVESMRQELDYVHEQKEEADALVHDLTSEVVNMQKEVEQKDKILSALLRKSESDAAEKQLLLREIKISEARRKQEELHSGKWRNFIESCNEKDPRSNSPRTAHLTPEIWIESGTSHYKQEELHNSGNRLHPRTLLIDYFQIEHGRELESVEPTRVGGTGVDYSTQESIHENSELVIKASVKQLEEWVQLETEKYLSILEQRHFTEIDAFIEQMKHKDEKVEASHWQFLGIELELKRLQSCVEGLDWNLSQSKEENMKLEAMLSDKENELKSIRMELEQCMQHFQMSNSECYLSPPTPSAEGAWPEPTAIKRKLLYEREKGEAAHLSLTKEIQADHDKDAVDLKHVLKEVHFEKAENHKDVFHIDDIKKFESVDSKLLSDQVKNEQKIEKLRGETQFQGPVQEPWLPERSSEGEIEKEKELGVDTNHVQGENEIPNKPMPARRSLISKGNQWRVDLHALGVSYKIKRSKQQLLMLANFTANQSFKKPTDIENEVHATEYSNKKLSIEDDEPTKSISLLASVLNKQLKRYQSLEEKTDDLCRRMLESDCGGSMKNSCTGRSKKQTGAMQHFLEETFQLQRYMVATGQKLMELQSRVACIFVGNPELRKLGGFDMMQFADGIRTLFREIQRGLEIRIARIIGDLEGTLACQGILNLSK